MPGRCKALGDYIRHRALPAGKEESMMDDTKRALLGDREAAKRLTDAGVLLPCPMCGATIDRQAEKDTLMLNEFQLGKWCFIHFCNETCDGVTIYGKTEAEVIAKWNTRAPILSGSEREMLDAKD